MQETELKLSCPNQIIKHFNGMSKAVEALLVDRGTLYLWINQGYVPPGNALMVEKATGGAIALRDMLEEANEIKPPKSKLRKLVKGE